MKVRKAVIPVAGLGTRFLPATKAIPKEMLTIVDRPDHPVYRQKRWPPALTRSFSSPALANQPLKIILIMIFTWMCAKEKKKIILGEELNNISNLIDIVSIRQKKPLGLGHAIWTARHVVGDERLSWSCLVMIWS